MEHSILEWIIIIIIGTPVGIGLFVSLSNNLVDPQYEEWLTTDKAKYPELYRD